MTDSQPREGGDEPAAMVLAEEWGPVPGEGSEARETRSSLCLKNDSDHRAGKGLRRVRPDASREAGGSCLSRKRSSSSRGNRWQEKPDATDRKGHGVGKGADIPERWRSHRGTPTDAALPSQEEALLPEGSVWEPLVHHLLRRMGCAWVCTWWWSVQPTRPPPSLASDPQRAPHQQSQLCANLFFIFKNT